MNRITRPVHTITLIGLLVAVVAIAAVGIAGESTPAESAGTTKILLSYSPLSPVHAANVIVNPDGMYRDVYVWAVSVKEPTGVSAYRADIKFDDSRVTAVTWAADLTWLGSGNPPRSPSCPLPEIEPNHLFMDCFTQDGQPNVPTPTPSGPDLSGPYGVTGTGLLAKLTLDPAVEGPLTILDLSGSFLVDTPDFPASPAHIPLTVLSSNLLYLPCADTNGDFVVDLLNDILGVIQHYSPTGAIPPYDPAFDLNNDGAIDLLNDILNAITHYQVPCGMPTPTPTPTP